MKAVIMAGGRGTRISSIANNVPKSMIKINGKPILEYEIECLRDQGFTEIIITVSHLSNIIIEYFGDGSKESPVTGKPFRVQIEYYKETEPLGNAGALFRIKDKLTEDFLLLNADSIFNVDFHKFIKFHKEKGGIVTLFTHPNNHPYDSGLIITDANMIVQNWLLKNEIRPLYYKNRVNAGLHVLSPKIFDKYIFTEKVDLDCQLLKPLQGTGMMYAYDSPEYVKDMGTPERYVSVCHDIDRGIVKAKNLNNKQKAIFIDRDGTINRYVGFLCNIDDFELLPNVSSAIKKINSSEYLIIVVTNQPIIARGEISYEQLFNIHNKMETLLGNDGAYVDAIYYCPHHPHKGFDGEIPELKYVCDCRKPKAGMLLQAAKDFNIDLSKSWMIGDSDSDVIAGITAGCKTAKIGTDFCNANLTIPSLNDFILEVFKES